MNKKIFQRKNWRKENLKRINDNKFNTTNTQQASQRVITNIPKKY